MLDSIKTEQYTFDTGLCDLRAFLNAAVVEVFDKPAYPGSVVALLRALLLCGFRV